MKHETVGVASRSFLFVLAETYFQGQLTYSLQSLAGPAAGEGSGGTADTEAHACSMDGTAEAFSFPLPEETDWLQTVLTHPSQQNAGGFSRNRFKRDWRR